MATAIAETASDASLARTWARHAIHRAVRNAGPSGLSASWLALVFVPGRGRPIPAAERAPILAELIREGLVVERSARDSNKGVAARVYILAELAEGA